MSLPNGPSLTRYLGNNLDLLVLTYFNRPFAFLLARLFSPENIDHFGMDEHDLFDYAVDTANVPLARITARLGAHLHLMRAVVRAAHTGCMAMMGFLELEIEDRGDYKKALLYYQRYMRQIACSKYSTPIRWMLRRGLCNYNEMFIGAVSVGNTNTLELIYQHVTLSVNTIVVVMQISVPVVQWFYTKLWIKFPWLDVFYIATRNKCHDTRSYIRNVIAQHLTPEDRQYLRILNGERPVTIYHYQPDTVTVCVKQAAMIGNHQVILALSYLRDIDWCNVVLNACDIPTLELIINCTQCIGINWNHVLANATGVHNNVHLMLYAIRRGATAYKIGRAHV